VFFAQLDEHDSSLPGFVRDEFEASTFPRGDELLPGGHHRCNIWQGTFPSGDLGAVRHHPQKAEAAQPTCTTGNTTREAWPAPRSSVMRGGRPSGMRVKWSLSLSATDMRSRCPARKR